MKTTRHSLMAKGLMVLLSLLILVFTFTFSWFSVAQPDADVSGGEFNTSSGADFEYAIGFKTSQTGGAYLVTEFTNSEHAQLDIEDLHVPGYTVTVNGAQQPQSFNLLYDYSPIDITGDGVTLIRPNMEYGNWKVNTGTNDYSEAEANTQYISFDIIVRSKNPTTLSLGPNSYAYGEAETDPGDGSLSGSSVARKSDYGNFSTDAIVGAVRVAFIDYNNSQQDITVNNILTTLMDDKLASTPSLLWVTRPDLYLNNNGRDAEVTGWSLNTGVLPSQAFSHQSAALGAVSGYTTYQHQQYNIFNSNDNQIITNTNSYVHISSKDENDNYFKFNDTVPVTSVSYLYDTNNNGICDATDEYYYGRVRVRIWVEGTDSESRRALSGGKFNIKFDLTTN